MFFYTVFVLSWIVFFFLVPRKNFVEVYPTALVAVIMSLGSDALHRYIELWNYVDIHTHFPEYSVTFLDDFGIYPVIASVYVLYAPKTFGKLAGYMFLWTLGGIAVEWLMAFTGYMVYTKGWCLLFSYIADWVIFVLLWAHHKWYRSLLGRPRLTFEDSERAYLRGSQHLYSVKSSRILKTSKYSEGVKLYLGAHCEEVESFFSSLEPGAVIRAKAHAGYEIHFVIEGELTVNKGGVDQVIASGGVTGFPSTTVHGFRNEGDAVVKTVSIVVNDLPFSAQIPEGTALQSV